MAWAGPLFFAMYDAGEGAGIRLEGVFNNRTAAEERVRTLVSASKLRTAAGYVAKGLDRLTLTTPTVVMEEI